MSEDEVIERQFARIKYRTGLFQRRGMEPKAAAELADILAVRDEQRDDRRMCIECRGYQAPQPSYPNSGCGPAKLLKQGVRKLAFAHTSHMSPIPDLLQRCNAFQFQTP